MSEKATVVAAVLSTNNYSIFSRMPGNRTVEYARIARLKKSIETSGWIRCPIIVNEKLQIIDGQGRFEALKALGLPIEYIVTPGLGMKECVVFNSTQSKWTSKDYIKSYAETGHKDYERLQKLITDFPDLPEALIVFVCNHSREYSAKLLYSGEFKLDEGYYSESRELFDYLNQFVSLKAHINGSWTHFLKAIAFTAGLEEIDRNLLLKKCQMNISKAIPIININSALKSIELMYNFRAKEPVYLVTAYDQYLRGKYSWYGNKWGNARNEK